MRNAKARFVPRAALLGIAGLLFGYKLEGQELPLRVPPGGWVRHVPPSAEVTAAYFDLVNTGSEPEVLVGAKSPSCAEIELHETVEQDGKMRMLRVERMVVPAGGKFQLKPRGSHLMLIGLKQPLREGSTVRIQLQFESGKALEVELPVRLSAPSPPVHEHGS